VPLIRHLSGSDLVAKVAAVHEVAVTLALLAEQYGLHHRDVKPENLF
jgi:hypothetical protein